MLHEHARWVEPVVAQLPQITRTSGQLARAVSRSRCNAASTRIAQRLQRQLQTTARDMQVLSNQLASETCPPILGVRDLLGELDQLASEFGEWNYDTPSSELSVTTEPIHLEGIELGSFSIRLRLGQPITQLIGRLCWVQALEPNPASGNSEVTHPHVSGEAVCVGDYGPELARALRSGRVCDFFLMIRSILTTYNPGSPYVSLDEWHGEPCADCGRSTDEDDRSSCQACDRSVCDDCISTCPHCDTSLCFGCVTTCRSCEQSSCAECLATCNGCGAIVCPDCIEDELCPTCLENRDDDDDNPEEDNEEQEHETPQEQDASVT